VRHYWGNPLDSSENGDGLGGGWAAGGPCLEAEREGGADSSCTAEGLGVTVSRGGPKPCGGGWAFLGPLGTHL
jgi:hypothetical protein